MLDGQTEWRWAFRYVLRCRYPLIFAACCFEKARTSAPASLTTNPPPFRLAEKRDKNSPEQSLSQKPNCISRERMRQTESPPRKGRRVRRPALLSLPWDSYPMCYVDSRLCNPSRGCVPQSERHRATDMEALTGLGDKNSPSNKSSTSKREPTRHLQLTVDR